MKAFSILLVVGLLCSFTPHTNAVGICATDEICGYTDIDVNIPFFSANHSLSTLLSVQQFHAIRDTGFTLGTVGGITFSSDAGVDIRSLDDIRMSAAVGGDFVFRGQEVSLNSGDLSSFWVANEAIIDTKEDIVMSVPAGTIDFQSHFETKFSSVNGMILSSSEGDVRLAAPQGTARLHGDTIGLVGGDELFDSGINIQSFDKTLIQADREFDLFSESNIELTAFTALTINSKINNIEFEAADTMTISAESNVISSAANDIVFETLLGDLLVNTDGVFSMYARNLQHKSIDISLDSSGSFIVDGSGHANFISKKDNSLTIDNAMIIALESLQFRGTSDGDITFDLNALTQTSSDLFVQAADLAESSIQFTAGNLLYQTTHNDIHMDTHLATFNVVDDSRFTAGSDFLFFGSRYHYTAGPVSDESGLIQLATGGSTSFDADRNIQLNSDSSVSVTAGTDISMTAADRYRVSSLLRTSFLATDITFNANNDFSLESGTNSQFFALSSALFEGRQSNTFSATNNMIANADDYIHIDAGEVTMQSFLGQMFTRADSISLTASDQVEVDANEDDDQFTDVFTPQDLIMTGGEVFVRSGEVLTFQVPSSDASFTANDEIEFKSFDHFMTSITGSINFQDGILNAQADNIFFRAGNDFSLLNPDNSITISSIRTDIIAGSAIGLTADTLELHSDQTVSFEGDNSVSFFSTGDLDLSPTEDGDFQIFGGRVDILAFQEDLTITGTHKGTISSGDNNNIELLSKDNLEVNVAGDLNFSAKHFNLRSESSFVSEADNDYTITTNDGDLIFSAIGYTEAINPPVTTISVGNAATYSGDNFLAHSFSKDGNWLLTGTPISVTADRSILFDGEGTFDFETDEDFVISGDTMTVNFLPNNQETPSDMDVDGDVDFLSCDGDIRLVTGKLTHTSPNLLVSQIVNPCGDCDNCTAGNFDIITHSEFTQTYNSNAQTFTAVDNLTLRGGRADFLSVGSLTVNSATSVTITSQNDDSRLVDSFDDKVRAGNQVLITSVEQMTFESVGFVDLPDTPSVEMGFEIDVHSGDVDFLIPTASFNVNAENDFIRFSSGDIFDTTEPENTNIDIRNTRDLIVDGGQGNIVLQAWDQINNPAATDDAAIEFAAIRGDFKIHSNQSNVVFASSQDQVTDTRQGKITWIAGETITHIATEHDGQLLYNPLLDILQFTIEDNIMLTAGEEFYDSDISMTAARNFEVSTLAEQRYLSTGPNTNEDEDSIILLGDEGPIRFTTPRNQQIYASGTAHYESETSELTITAVEDISFFGASEANFFSQFDVPIDVSDGDIRLAAEGGGSSVDIISDSAQGITTTAEDSIFFTAEDSSFVYTKTGINMTTTLGDITFTQNGDLQNTHFHSEGSLLLQAFQPDGIQFTASDFVASAKRDILFDATESFSIGASSDANSATEPTIEFHAGDDTNAGIVFDVLGGMQWTTTKRGAIRFEADRASWTTGDDIQMTSNGPIRFINKGEFDSTSFAITTQALLNLNGGVAVELASEKSVKLDADEDITFTATGTQSFDISLIRSENDLIINADTLTTTTNVLTGEVTDFLLDVNGPLVITNTPGDGGSFTFASDSTLSVVSQGPVNLQSTGFTDIRTDGPYSDILFVSAGDQSIVSGGSLIAEGASIDIDAPSGVTVESRTGDINFVASDDIQMRSNATISLDGRDQVTIEAGLETTTLIPSQLNITSRGQLTMQAVDDFVFTAVDPGSDIRVIADAGLTLSNQAPTRPSDQGDILIDSEGDYAITSGDDAFVNAGRNVFIEGTRIDIESGDDMSFTSTHPTASVLIDAEDITMDSNHEFTLGVLTDLSITSENNFNWEQINEEGIGGITISSTGAGLPTTLTSQQASLIRAQSRVEADTNGYLLFDVATSIRLETTAHGADITLSNQGTGGMTVDVDDTFSIIDTNDDNPIRINAFGITDGTPPTIAINGENDVISFSSISRESDEFFTANNILFNNPDTGGSTTSFTSTSSLALISNGVNRETSPAPNRRLYGISVESDDTIEFMSNRGDIRMESQQGSNLFTASEDFSISPTQRVNMFSGNDLIISTGFTPQPNLQVGDRTGILFNGVSASSFRSNHHDVIMSAEDVSWSNTATISIRSGGSTSITTENSLFNWVSDSVDSHSEHVDITANNDVFLASQNAVVEVVARESIYLIAEEGQIGFETVLLNIRADNQILFTTPNSYVEVPSSADFIVPPLIDEGGVSGSGLPHGDQYRSQEENQYPNCEERSFGFDVNSHAFCYCQFNKWRCKLTEILGP